MHGMHDQLDYELGAFEDDDFYSDEEYIDQYCPPQRGSTQPKIWWTYSRKDEGLNTDKLRRRRRNYEIRVSNIPNHGRDMAECWEARDRGRRRKLEQSEDEHLYQFLNRANKVRRRYQRADQRKARATIRKMKTPDFYPEYGPQNFLENHLDF